jgi:REP element-mobilizing transposase RayT
VDIVDSALTGWESAEPLQDQSSADEPLQDFAWESAEYELPSQEDEESSIEQASWLSSKNLAAQHLARLSMSTSSQAALILRRNQLWAYAGHLNQDSVQELAQLVQHGSGTSLLDNRSSSERGADLARFVHLKSTGEEHLLYATSFESEMLLVLAFDARTPFSEIRNQANQLAAALVSPPEPVLIDVQQPQSVNHAESLMAENASRQVIETDIERGGETGWALEFDTEQEAEPGLEDIASDQDSTQPVHINKPLEAASPSISAMLYDLHYACVLVPRLPDHYLIGDLSTSLSQWMQRLSLAFGWRLEYLAVRPHCIQWIAAVEPEISAEQVVQQIRRSTSSMIFAEFPRFAVDNPSADFWAPGYLVMTSTKPLPGEIVKEFTERTRLRQGMPGVN